MFNAQPTGTVISRLSIVREYTNRSQALVWKAAYTGSKPALLVRRLVLLWPGGRCNGAVYVCCQFCQAVSVLGLCMFVVVNSAGRVLAVTLRLVLLCLLCQAVGVLGLCVVRPVSVL